MLCMPKLALLAVVALLAAQAAAVTLSRDRRSLDLAASSSSAQVEHDSKETEYGMEVEVDDYEVSIESSRETADGHEEVDFELKCGDYPRLEFEAELESGGNKTRDRLRLEFRRLVRFNPTDLSAGYQNETVLEEIDLKDDVTWDTISCTALTGNLTGVFACVMSTTDNVFKLKATFAGATFVKNNAAVTPRQCKIELVVNLPLNGHPATSAVMLEAKMRTKSKFTPEDGVEVVSFGSAAVFEWETFFTDELLAQYPVVAGDSVADPETDDDEGEDDEDILKTYTFAKAGVTSVNWDPVFGAASSSTSGGGGSGSSSGSTLSSTQTVAVGAGVAAFVVLAVVVAVVVIKKRT